MPYVLAVDSGNTKTIALIAALDGSILGSGRAGSGDIYNSTHVNTQGLSNEEYALANIGYAVTQALQAAHVDLNELEAAVFNQAGADWPEDFILLQDAMRARGFGRLIHVQNDALGVLHSGSPDNVGVAIVCGTGAAVGGRGRDGRVWHASFWLNVNGSVELSHRVLEAVYQAELGLGEPTALKQHVLNLFHLDTVEEVLHHLTRRAKQATDTPRIDSLTPLLLDEADAGDKVARRIVWEHGWQLGGYAIVAARRVGIEHTPFPLVMAGGVLRHRSTLLANAIIQRVQETAPDVQPIRSPYEPIIGALLSALDLAGVPIDKAIHAQVKATHPPDILFETRLNGLRHHAP
jgi:N-acetylglucosamine kinase-like BadF-type ATPase